MSRCCRTIICGGYLISDPLLQLSIPLPHSWPQSYNASGPVAPPKPSGTLICDTVGRPLEPTWSNLPIGYLIWGLLWRRARIFLNRGFYSKFQKFLGDLWAVIALIDIKIELKTSYLMYKYRFVSSKLLHLYFFAIFESRVKLTSFAHFKKLLRCNIRCQRNKYAYTKGLS